MGWEEVKALLFPAVMSPKAERLLRHESVRQAIGRLVDGYEGSTQAKVNGQTWRVSVRRW